jgi:hypothetical protein
MQGKNGAKPVGGARKSLALRHRRSKTISERPHNSDGEERRLVDEEKKALLGDARLALVLARTLALRGELGAISPENAAS